MFNADQTEEFSRSGFIIERGLVDSGVCRKMLDVVDNSLHPPLGPLEFETDVQYPGSPAGRLSPGGDTTRRLLHAFTRDAVFRTWATSPKVAGRVKRLLASDRIAVSQNHHNCIMTKHPGFSSETLWHQDIRYWLFDKPDLVSIWLALGEEHVNNGGIRLIPGSHRQHLDRGRFDAALFLRPDLDENRALIDSAVPAELSQGDVLFFHSRTIHAAGQNNTNQVKTSVIFTYRDEGNLPLAESRSARYPDIPC